MNNMKLTTKSIIMTRFHRFLMILLVMMILLGLLIPSSSSSSPSSLLSASQQQEEEEVLIEKQQQQQEEEEVSMKLTTKSIMMRFHHFQILLVMMILLGLLIPSSSSSLLLSASQQQQQQEVLIKKQQQQQQQEEEVSMKLTTKSIMTRFHRFQILLVMMILLGLLIPSSSSSPSSLLSASQQQQQQQQQQEVSMTSTSSSIEIIPDNNNIARKNSNQKTTTTSNKEKGIMSSKTNQINQQQIRELQETIIPSGYCKISPLALRDVRGGRAGVSKMGQCSRVTGIPQPDDDPQPDDEETPDPSPPPTPNPTAPPTTYEPTPDPLEDFGYVEPNPVPENPPRGYFNYDWNDRRYGPRGWDDVDTSQSFMKEFGTRGFGPWKNHYDDDTSDNKCGRPDRRQSPKNMRRTTGCDAHHEIRTDCGRYPLSSDQYVKQILPHKLSLVMNRRPCIDMGRSNCQRNDPPKADYPRYSSGVTSYSDMINYDIKVPGEHTIEGEKFDAEIQMLHAFPTSTRMSSIGLSIKAKDDPVDSFNGEFQQILNEFQSLYDANVATCTARRRNKNMRNTAEEGVGEAASLNATTATTNNLGNDKAGYGGSSSSSSSSSADFHYTNSTTATNIGRSLNNDHNHNARFDPYSDALMPTIFFYRYDGSITEPPCKAITWWVMEDPVIISTRQLNQLKKILFTNIDPNTDCKHTSVHNRDQSVARPIFSLDGHEIQDCGSGSFTSDFQKHGYQGKKCRGT